MPELDTTATEIHDLAQYVALLDKLGAFTDGEYHEIEGEIGPEEWTGDHLLRVVAQGIAVRVASRHGTGSWAASHALRGLTDDDVALLLAAFGATTFTVQGHTERIRGIIRSNAAAGGA